MVKPSEPGIRRCMRCGWLFVSPDPARVGRCHDCKQDDNYQPKQAKVVQVDSAVKFHFTGAT